MALSAATKTILLRPYPRKRSSNHGICRRETMPHGSYRLQYSIWYGSCGEGRADVRSRSASAWPPCKGLTLPSGATASPAGRECGGISRRGRLAKLTIVTVRAAAGGSLQNVLKDHVLLCSLVEAPCGHLSDLPLVVVGAGLRVRVVRVEPHEAPRPEVIHGARFGPLRSMIYRG